MMNFRPVRLVACLLALTTGVTVAAQSQAPTFRSGVVLVTVDVAVFDGDGRAVPGLDAGAFEVRLNGRPQPIKVVSYLEARGELTTATPAPKAPARPAWDGRPGRQTVTNAGIVDPRAAVGEDRVFVILIDNLSIPSSRGHRLFLAAQKFVSGLPPGDPIAVVHTSDPSRPVGPTLSRDVIIKALSEIRGSAVDLSSVQVQGQADADGPAGPVGIHQALEIDHGVAQALKNAIAQACFAGDTREVDAQVLDVLIAQNQCAGRVTRDARIVAAQTKQIRTNQVSAIAGVIAAMGAADGIRHLVILSDGIAVGRATESLNPVAEAAARAGVQVSVLMEDHDMSLGDESRSPNVVAGTDPAIQRLDNGAPSRRLEDQRMLREGLQAVTGVVGGQFYRVVGDPAPFFERVRTASAAVYRLGIELPAGLTAGQSMTVDAQVKRPGVSVFVNRHAFVPAPAPAVPPKIVTTDDMLKAAVSAGEEHGAVPLHTATLLRRAPGGSGHVEVTLQVEVPASGTPVRGPLAVMFGVVPMRDGRPASGAAMTSGRQVIAAAGPSGAFQSSFAIPVAPGVYHLRVAVADAEGALGAIATDLDANLPTLGPFQGSDLLVAWVDANGQPRLIALDPIPAAATGVRAELELYPPADGVRIDDVQVEISVTKAGDAEALDERLVTPRNTNGVWRAATEFSSDMLGEGRYTLRARVTVGDTVVGSALATFVR